VEREKADKAIVRFFLYRPIWLPALVVTLLLVVSLVLLVGVSWRSFDRVRPVRAHMATLDRLDAAEVHLRQMLDGLDGGRSPNPQTARALLEEVARLQSLKAPGAAGHPAAAAGGMEHALRQALATVHQLARAGRHEHSALVDELADSARYELFVSLSLAALLPIMALLLLLLLRRRILLPLQNLRNLMAALAKPEYLSVPTSGLDPLLQPVFEHYNLLVDRLRVLESEHVARRESLEEEVRSATRTVLQQQRDLAQAERLAAVGEVAASLAHEIRNPLAGARMALSSLREDLSDPDHVDRLTLVLGELKRMGIPLDRLLDQARGAPPRPTVLDLGNVVEEVLGFVRHQVPPDVELRHAIPADVQCRAPEDGLRRALLNLVLNAAQAIGDGPGSVVVEALRQDGRLQISVCDDGPGLPAELLEVGPRAFASWREGGTGLGLATVRRFARDLDGELLLANREPRGACVTLSLRDVTAHG